VCMPSSSDSRPAGGRDAPTSDGDETIASMRNRSSDQGAAWMLTSRV
jgi:hypothetical protein